MNVGMIMLPIDDLATARLLERVISSHIDTLVFDSRERGGADVKLLEKVEARLNRIINAASGQT